MEAGKVVGDDLRQHRDHFVRKVHAGGAIVGFVVQFRSQWYEVGNVCDVYAQLPVSVLKFDERDRVVKVACFFGIDRDDGVAGKVGTGIRDRFIEFVGLSAGALHCFFGKLTGQSEFVDHGLRVDSGLAAIAEDFYDYPFAVSFC